MFDPHSLDDLSLLAETADLECKLSQGEDGKGALPKDFWLTYSAMANAHGGTVLLGVQEKQGRFSVAGIEDIEKVRRDLFNNLNNPTKVSVNLLSDADVTTQTIEGKSILVVQIPPAPRKQKPVYLNGQPLGNTWRRLNDGDRRCDDEEVKRMMVEQVEDERDRRILRRYTMADLDLESLRVYRQMLRDEKPGHPFLDLDDFEFLRQIGGWRRDRESGEEGLTLAGLLMFGKWSAIQEAVPHYFVDYQERPEARTENRWVDRLVPDGTWSGNIFDFYRRVYRKLVADLKVPFSLKDGQRQDDTLVHEVLREALVNTLVHADYTGRLSILVVKRPDMFGFRNPGGLRLPLEQVIHGGESDCRNRLMHQMFLMIGLGERAGSGLPKIYSGWKSQHWRQPLLQEKDNPEQTLLALHMMDLLPESVVAELRERFGQQFDSLNHGERLILATAAIEQVVNHARLAEISDLHPHDLSTCLAKLERDDMLQSDGRSRGKVYFLPGARPISPEQVFSDGVSSGHNEVSSGHNELSSGHNAEISGYNEGCASGTIQLNRDEAGCLLSDLLDAPIVDNLEDLASELRGELEALAAAPRTKARLEPRAMEAVILAVCRDRYLTLGVLAKLLHRHSDTLRKTYLDRLVKTNRIKRAFPGTPTHEKQSYRTVGNDEGDRA